VDGREPPHAVPVAVPVVGVVAARVDALGEPRFEVVALDEPRQAAHVVAVPVRDDEALGLDGELREGVRDRVRRPLEAGVHERHRVAVEDEHAVAAAVRLRDCHVVHVGG